MHLGEESLPGRVDALDVCQYHPDRNFGGDVPEWSPRAAQLFHRVALESSRELQNVGCARLGGELVCRDDPECGWWLRMHESSHRLMSLARRARWTRGRSALDGDPLANVGGTVLQSDAGGFAAGEETDDLAVDESRFLEVERDSMSAGILLDHPLQLREMLFFDAAAQSQPHASAISRSLDLQHPKGPFSETARLPEQSGRHGEDL